MVAAPRHDIAGRGAPSARAPSLATATTVLLNGIVSLGVVLLIGYAAPRGAHAQTVVPRPEVDSLPIRLLRQYLGRDAQGERLGGDLWWDRLVIWQEEPGWDGYAVIAGYHVEAIHRDSSTARFRVIYDVVGSIDAANQVRYVRNHRKQTVAFTLVLTDNGWRIAAPQIEPHVLASKVPRSTHLSSADWRDLSEDAKAERSRRK